MRILFSSIFSVMSAVIYLFPASPACGETLDRSLAVVNGEVITLSDYQRYMISLGKKRDLSVIDEKHLKRLVEEKVLLGEAIKRGGTVTDTEIDILLDETRKASAVSDEELRRELLREGVSYEEYRRVMKEKLLVTKLIRIDIDTKITVTDKETEEYYILQKGRFVKSPSKAGIKVIFIRLKQDVTLTELTDLKRKALKIMAHIRDGYDFDTMKDRYSEEPWSSRDSRLGEFSRGELIPELDTLVFAMTQEEIRGPLWLKDGVYVVKLVKRTEEEVRSLQEVRNEIERTLFEQKRERLYNQWMKSLLDSSSITIIE